MVHRVRRRPDRADHAGGRRHRVLDRHHRRARARSGSRPAPTATSGSPSDGDRIGRITPAGVVTEFSAGITPGSGAVGHHGRPRRQPLVHGGRRRPDRADHAGGRRHRVLGRHHRRAAVPYGIAAGPDGNLWFTEYDGDRIGRITPAGVVTEFSAGITRTATDRDHGGPDGNLWFTEAGEPDRADHDRRAARRRRRRRAGASDNCPARRTRTSATATGTGSATRASRARRPIAISTAWGMPPTTAPLSPTPPSRTVTTMASAMPARCCRRGPPAGGRGERDGHGSSRGRCS